MLLVRVLSIFLLAICFSHARYAPIFKKHLDVALSNIEVILPENATKAEIEASEILLEEIAKIRPDFSRSSDAKCVRFIFKNTNALERDLPLLELISKNAYVVNVGKTAITLEYPSSDKSYWIVGKFLRDFCKVDYFSPEPWGAEYNKSTLRFKTGRYEFFPHYFVASFYDGRHSHRWRALNGLDVQTPFLHFSHNLNRIFTKDLFKASPEYFSLRRNAKNELVRVPTGQPDLLNYRTQHYAAEKALLALREKKMFSLGINDSIFVDERPEYAKYKRGYFRGYPDWSNAVFDFSNAVAERVSKSNPSAILGMLAYLISENPPDFKVHKNLVPMYTVDRANYADVNYAKKDFEILSKWGNSGCASFGIYEYMYGAPYLFARDISSFSSAGIAKAYESGARFYFAETLAMWGYDACKLWLTARMLENSSQDFESLRNYFFENYYKDCADDMREFFRLAESVWLKRNVPTRWLAFFKAENALELLNASLLEDMRAFLESAQKKARHSIDKNVALRVEETAKLFEMTVVAYNLYISKLKTIDLISAKADTEKLLKAFEEYQRNRNSFLGIIDECLPRAKSLYEVEKYFPLDALISELHKRDAFKNTNCNSLNKLRRTSEFVAISTLSKGASFLYEVNGWKNFRDNFSVINRDFENISLTPKRYLSKDGLAFENCELTGIFKKFDASENSSVEFSGRVLNKSSAGTLSYAGMIFIDASNNVLKRKTFIFPNRTDINFVLADVAPKGTKTVAVMVFATRQKQGDLLLLEKISLKK